MIFKSRYYGGKKGDVFMSSVWLPIVIPPNENHNSILIRKALLTQYADRFTDDCLFGYGGFLRKTEDPYNVPHQMRLFHVDRIRLDSIMNNVRIMGEVRPTEQGRDNKDLEAMLRNHYHYHLVPCFDYYEKEDILLLYNMDIFFNDDTLTYYKG